MAKKRRKTPRRKVEVDGQKFLLPVVAAGRTTTEEDRLQLAEFICSLYSTNNYSLRQVLAAAGISSTETWYRWTQESEEIDTLYLEAQEMRSRVYTGGLVEKARTMLERHLEGYTVTTTEQHLEPTIPADNAEPVMVVVKEVQKQVYVKPVFRATEFVLTNLDQDNFAINPDPTANIELPDDIKIEIIGGTMPPVTSEDDITFDRSKYQNGNGNGNGNGKQ